MTSEGGRGRFAGRTVLITGSTGMAASAAKAVAAEGGTVFAVSRTATHLAELAGEVEAAGGTCKWHAADLRREPDVTRAFAAFDRMGRRLDAVYSVAGISGRRFGDGPLHEATLEGWETVLSTNATSQFLVARAALQRMLAQEPDANGSRGTILLMSSVLAQFPAAEHFGTHGYAASKGAIDGLARATASTYAADGIRINAIAPSLIATPMSQRAQDDPRIGRLPAREAAAGGRSDRHRGRHRGRAPPALGRRADGHRTGRHGGRRLERERARERRRRNRHSSALRSIGDEAHRSHGPSVVGRRRKYYRVPHSPLGEPRHMSRLRLIVAMAIALVLRAACRRAGRHL